MRVALVASSYPEHGVLERHVREVARGLTERGAAVEVLANGPVGRGESHRRRLGVTVRAFPIEAERLRLVVASGLWRRLKAIADTCDIVDVHTSNVTLALVVARAGCRRLVLTPHAPLGALMAWPYARALAMVVQQADRIVCGSDTERGSLCRMAPATARRAEVVPAGVDAMAIGQARPFPAEGPVILAIGPLRRSRRIDRAIAALPSLDQVFRLVVVGDGSTRHRLEAHARDLRVSRRVRFAGATSDSVLHRWLRTARVVVALADEANSGRQLLEALAAGATVVASDIPVHREIAERFGGDRVRLVAPEGSPLDVADAIAEASTRGEAERGDTPVLAIPSWESVAVRTWEVYRGLTRGEEAQPPAARAQTLALPITMASGARGRGA